MTLFAAPFGPFRQNHPDTFFSPLGQRAGRGCWLVLLLLVTGCPPPAERPYEPIPMDQAIAVVNTNTAQITTCLKATGSASGHFVDDQGRRQAFDLNAVVTVLAPHLLYASFKSGLGTEEMMLGSNPERFWLHIKRDDDTYRTGTYAALADDLDAPLPLRPDMLIEALGLDPLPEATVGAAGPVQRIDGAHQQVLFLAYDGSGQGVIRKEYWLDCREPRLIGKVLFRDAMGRVVMDSSLSDYAPLTGGGPLLARRIRVEWPQHHGVMDLRIRQWSPMPERGPGHPAFVAPHQRGERYRRMIDLDTGGPLR